MNKIGFINPFYQLVLACHRLSGRWCLIMDLCIKTLKKKKKKSKNLTSACFVIRGLYHLNLQHEMISTFSTVSFHFTILQHEHPTALYHLLILHNYMKFASNNNLQNMTLLPSVIYALTARQLTHHVNIPVSINITKQSTLTKPKDISCKSLL